MSAGSKIWKALVAGGAGIAALAALNRRVPRHELDSPPISARGAGESLIYRWHHGDVFYRLAGDETAQPLLLVHDVAPGVSSLMWWRNFAALAAQFQVYAVDLIGFGSSAKPPLAPYSTKLYVEQLADFARDVIGRPATVVASSLSTAFAAQLIAERRAPVSQLVLINPPGLEDEADVRAAGVRGAAFYSLLNSPVLGTSFYNALTSERALGDYARKQLFFNKRLATHGIIAHLYAQSHQPGANHAFIAYRTGYVTANIKTFLPLLDVPTAMLLDSTYDERRVNQLKSELRNINSNIIIERFANSRLWLNAEHPERFNNFVSDFVEHEKR